MNKLFDFCNKISKKLQDHSKSLDSLKKSQKEVLEVLSKLSDTIDDVGAHVRQDDVDADLDDRIPPEVSSEVHLIYDKLAENERFKPQESMLSAHNASVRLFLEEQIIAKNKGFSVKYIKRAVVRYYETKRKLFLQSLPQNKEKTTKAMLDNKIRSRRKRLYGARVKVAQGSDLDAVKELTYHYVSDEENGENDNKGKWIVRAPAWRSEEANSLMKQLQEKVEASNADRPKVPRIDGPSSNRGRPRSCIAWAVKQNEQQEIHGKLKESFSCKQFKGTLKESFSCKQCKGTLKEGKSRSFPFSRKIKESFFHAK
ncbi:hypothetical protein QZH41_011921, partial [Actinostola sp. cb2023]